MPIELQARREALGLSQAALARILGVEQSTVSQWESGDHAIAAGTSAYLEHLEERLEKMIDLALAGIGAAGANSAMLFTWPDDHSFWRAHPDFDGTPAVLHRIAMARARVLAEHPDVTIAILPADAARA